MTKRVLSIQSHVVSGYVGNKSATFPLQLLGADVDPLNTVQFSNHSGYPQFPGERISEETLTSLLRGLRDNGLLPGYSHILCGVLLHNQAFLVYCRFLSVPGYMGKAATVNIVKDLLQEIKSKYPFVNVFLDPVMGDNKRIYVPAESVALYKEMLHFADILFPNGFEAEYDFTYKH